jgi:hypothetical protein
MAAAPPVVRSAEVEWVDALVHAMTLAKSEDGGADGAWYAPYLAQLQSAREAMRRGDQAATYTAMNRFMDMLNGREYGIRADLADWLFDYCAEVTPPQYHDITRHRLARA